MLDLCLECLQIRLKFFRANYNIDEHFDVLASMSHSIDNRCDFYIKTALVALSHDNDFERSGISLFAANVRSALFCIFGSSYLFIMTYCRLQSFIFQRALRWLDWVLFEAHLRCLMAKCIAAKNLVPIKNLVARLGIDSSFF